MLKKNKRPTSKVPTDFKGSHRETPWKIPVKTRTLCHRPPGLSDALKTICNKIDNNVTKKLFIGPFAKGRRGCHIQIWDCT